MTEKSSVIIRGGTPADMQAAGKLGALLVRIHHVFDPLRFIPAAEGIEAGYASFLKSQLGKPDVIVLIAELSGEVVGYSYSGVEERDYMALRGPAGVVYDIVVDPLHRHQGIGGMLLESTVRELQLRGAPRAILSTAEKNEAAQRLFARAGFRRTMIEMTRELKP